MADSIKIYDKLMNIRKNDNVDYSGRDFLIEVYDNSNMVPCDIWFGTYLVKCIRIHFGMSLNADILMMSFRLLEEYDSEEYFNMDFRYERFLEDSNYLFKYPVDGCKTYDEIFNDAKKLTKAKQKLSKKERQLIEKLSKHIAKISDFECETSDLEEYSDKVTNGNKTSYFAKRQTIINKSQKINNSDHQKEINEIVVSVNQQPIESTDIVSNLSDEIDNVPNSQHKETQIADEALPNNTVKQKNISKKKILLFSSIVVLVIIAVVAVGYKLHNRSAPRPSVTLDQIINGEHHTNLKVRNIDNSEEDWCDFTEAEVGQQLEFLIEYSIPTEVPKFASDSDVLAKIYLPDNIEYSQGSTARYSFKDHTWGINSDSSPSGDIPNELFYSNGLRMGDYYESPFYLVTFKAYVVDKNLSNGKNNVFVKGEVNTMNTSQALQAQVVVDK